MVEKVGKGKKERYIKIERGTREKEEREKNKGEREENEKKKKRKTHKQR